MKIAALLTCYNRVEITIRGLKSFVSTVEHYKSQYQASPLSVDIYLVDDASPDRTGEKVKEWFNSITVACELAMKIIPSQGGLYWCKGMRLAWDTAIASGVDYDFYLWLNDDVRLKVDALKTAIADYYATKDEAATIVGAFSSDESEREVSYSAICLKRGRLRPSGAPVAVHGYLNGNFVLVSRRAYKAIGPICGLYSHGKGDYDYGAQLNKHGLNFYCTSKFIGVCSMQPERYLHLKGRSLIGRWKLMFAPKGYNLRDTVIYRWRNNGLIRAMISFVHVVVLVTFGIEHGKENHENSHLPADCSRV